VRPFEMIACVALTSCLQIGAADTDAGTGGASSSASTATATDAAGTAKGSDCVDFGSGVVLCTSTSLCPTVGVDHDLYPNCGFRIPATSIDLECVCGDSLCPMGSALSCGQAGQLLTAQAEITVCTQASEGRCAKLTTSTPASSCDRSCAAGCVSDPLCLKLCGC
jgi:hypothetical protein